ncbi:MAG TPA: aldo/keto reductase, partial [Herpetosiphonaceae bacterium]|nr:aldo/keto reductase [Herpetosiphonaceae bacterium]
ESEWSRRHFTPEAFKVVDVLKRIAAAHECLPLQAALAWGLAHPGVASTVLGARTLGQFEEQAGAAALTLGEDDLRALDAVAPPGRALAPYYLSDSFQDFRPHRYRW